MLLTPLENGLGLDIVIWLRDHASALFDLLATGLDIAGGSMFLLIIGPVIYWSIDKRLGQRMLIMLLAGTLIAAFAKEVAQTPRPYVAHPDQVTPLFEEEGYGMPSGHVVNALVFWFPLAFWLGARRWRWTLAGYVVVVMWSRMYAGVHYPQDTVMSLFVGLPLITIYARRTSTNTDQIQPIRLTSPFWLASAALIVPALAAIFWHYEDGLTGVGACGGAIIGLWLDTRYLQFDTHTTPRKRALRYAVGILLTLALFFALSVLLGGEPVFRVIRYGVLLIFIAAGWPWLWSRFAPLR